MSRPPSPAPIVVIGVGATMRGDDGLGAAAIDRLAAGPLGALHGVELRVLDGEPSRLVAAWHGRRAAVVIDAAARGAAPGTIHRLEAGAVPAPAAGPGRSWHAAGVAEAVALARAIDRMPGELTVVGVEPADLGPGEGLSPPVAASLDDLLALVTDLVLAAVDSGFGTPGGAPRGTSRSRSQPTADA